MAYITNKEIKAIIKANNKQIKELNKKNSSYTKEDYITKMKNDDNIVEFDDLKTYFFTDNGVVKAVNGVTFEVPKNSIVGIVGESGCGKSVTSLSLMRLLQGPSGQIVDGSIRFKASDDVVYDIAKMPFKEMYNIRGKDITMIFQEPMTSLNPVFTIGNQLDEVSFLHNGFNKEQAKERSIEMLNLVGIPDPEMVYKKYPHELSGGMRQRVMISMALAANPKLIIADEPTTALDVTTQAEIIELLKDIKNESNSGIILITHDLGVVAEIAEKVVVMYFGQVVEECSVNEFFDNAMHPYSKALLDAMPDNFDGRFKSIEGNVPNLYEKVEGCPYYKRCLESGVECTKENSEMIDLGDGHKVRCIKFKNLAKGDVK